MGIKSGEDGGLLTLTERKTRNELILPLVSKSATEVLRGFEQLRDFFDNRFFEVFRTIIRDEGLLHSSLCFLYERGTNERYKGLIQLFLPKGKRINDYDLDDILLIEEWMNTLPRKSLGYSTPEELFDKELDRIDAT